MSQARTRRFLRAISRTDIECRTGPVRGLGSQGLLVQTLLPRWRVVPVTETGRAPFSFRKEVIQPQVLLRLPCYDFTPIMSHTLSVCLLAVGTTISSTTHFRDVTGGVYKARERIHGAVLMRHY
jgi:hypothetical protein